MDEQINQTKPNQTKPNQVHHKFSMMQAFVFYFLSSLIHIYIQQLPVSLMKIKRKYKHYSGGRWRKTYKWSQTSDVNTEPSFLLQDFNMENFKPTSGLRIL